VWAATPVPLVGSDRAYANLRRVGPRSPAKPIGSASSRVTARCVDLAVCETERECGRALWSDGSVELRSSLPTPFDDPGHQAGPYAGLLPSGLPFGHSSELRGRAGFRWLSKYANRLRVESAAVQWSERDARVNSISLGIIMTPLAQTERDSDRDRRFER
jgi:hypothetical protein